MNPAQNISPTNLSAGDAQRLPLSVAIITLNEEANLPRCLASVSGLAREIVVIDSGSRDGTAAVAQRFGAVFEVHPWKGHIAQKNIALRRCTQPWVLGIDADEVVSPELEAAIRQAFSPPGPSADGYWINRRSFYLGDWIRHTWYPEWRLRLVRREGAAWRGIDPHDMLEAPGTLARLEGDLLHYSYRDLEHHLHKIILYARTTADSYARGEANLSLVQPDLLTVVVIRETAGIQARLEGRLAGLADCGDWHVPHVRETRVPVGKENQPSQQSGDVC